MQQIADELNVNRSYLTTRFRHFTGCSIKTYQIQLRMKRAKAYMLDGNLSIQDVAANCGYRDPLFFSRMFHQYVGMSPTDYQKLLFRQKDR